MWQRNPLRKETKLILNDFGLRQKHFWNKHGYFCQFHLWCSKMHLPWYAKKCWVIYLFIIYRAHCSKTFFGRLWALHAISVFTHDASKGEKHVTSPKKFCIAMKCHDRMSWNDMTEFYIAFAKPLRSLSSIWYSLKYTISKWISAIKNDVFFSDLRWEQMTYEKCKTQENGVI